MCGVGSGERGDRMTPCKSKVNQSGGSVEEKREKEMGREVQATLSLPTPSQEQKSVNAQWAQE